VILLDTSVIYALADTRDVNHHQAAVRFEAALDEGETILVHNYVIVEATALLQNRLGLATALRFLEDTSNFHIHWVTAEDHRSAVMFVAERSRQGLSLVDCASFVVMRHYGVSQALAFDPDFEREGFGLYVGSRGP
jgi:predicted nucleic acid-binding protein